jgi:hypothetical protein
MSRFDFNAVSSYAAALAIAVWSTSMIYAATLVPAASAAASSVA